MNLRRTAPALLLVCTVAAAQQPKPAPQPPNPEQVQQVMRATLGAMVPLMAQMTEAMIESQLAVAARPETAERIAVFKKNLYESLLKRGFTQQQAVEIVVATALPSATPASK